MGAVVFVTPKHPPPRARTRIPANRGSEGHGIAVAVLLFPAQAPGRPRWHGWDLILQVLMGFHGFQPTGAA